MLGKPLRLLRIGSGPRHLHVNAALHANEWLTAPCLMRFLEEYAAAYASGADWTGDNACGLVPGLDALGRAMANPDGVELVQEGAMPDHPHYAELMRWNCGRRSFRHWKANIRGVDLGDQFPAHWEEERTGGGCPARAARLQRDGAAQRAGSGGTGGAGRAGSRRCRRIAAQPGGRDLLELPGL